ncbi:MAG: TonB-dependent receptor, partial [Candidatus Binatia bacterium]
GQYTFLDVDAEAGGRVRRPKHGGSIFAAVETGEIWTKGDVATLDLRLLLVGDRDDFDPEAFFAVRENPAYQRADVAAAYRWPVSAGALKRVGLFARVENLFDRDYEEALGFGARPLNFLAGFRAEL